MLADEIIENADDRSNPIQSKVTASEQWSTKLSRESQDLNYNGVTMSNRTFTLAEAQSLLPVLESLLRAAIEGKQMVESVDAEFEEITHKVFISGGMNLNIVRLARRKAEREKAAQRAKDSLAEIDAIGVQVKDLDIGLLDWPCAVDGHTVLLCWKLGEKGITHWHTTSEGFAGRKPIDEKIAKAKKTN